jgi:hypothetical protein
MQKKIFVLFLTLMMIAGFAVDAMAQFKVRRKPSKKDVVVVSERDPIDRIDGQMEKLGYGYAKPDDADAKALRPDDYVPFEYEGDFSGLNMFGSNGLIEVTSPHTAGRETLQVGFNFIDRRIGDDEDRITARASFQHLNFGLLERLDIGFGSTGYYKSSSNTTYTNLKFRLTNPERHRFSFSMGMRNYDFGSGGTGNVTNYYGALGFPLKNAEFFLNMVNNSNDNVGDLTFSGGMIFSGDFLRYPVALMIEGIQDSNNSFNKFNCGVRWAFSERAMIDFIIVRDINRNELSPSIGGTLSF